MKRFAAFLLTASTLSGCMSTRIVLSDKWDPNSRAVYEDYFNYYLWGLVGRPSVDLTKVCMDQKPLAVRRLISTEDGFIMGLTLGIYSPMTVRVWCGD